MKKQKHQLHCNVCGQAMTFYRKGRKHKVLVCPSCGIVAWNPLRSTLTKITTRLSPIFLGEKVGEKLGEFGVPIVGEVSSVLKGGREFIENRAGVKQRTESLNRSGTYQRRPTLTSELIMKEIYGTRR